MLLLGNAPSEETLYDVTDPLHPRLLCRIDHTSAHLYTGDTIVYLRSSSAATNIVLRSLSSGNETIVASIPRAGLGADYQTTIAWLPDGTLSAAAIQPSFPNTQVQVWLFSQAFTGLLYSYPWPQAGCVCRFASPPPPTLAFSPDRQYLVSGLPAGPGSGALTVFRLSDHSRVAAFDLNTTLAMWDLTGHRLFLSGMAGVQAWSPESGTVSLSGAKMWQYLPGLSPDGSQVAYTGYVDPLNQAAGTLRVYEYNVGLNSTRLLIDQSRSQVVFIKDGWVWYLDEPKCDASSDPGCLTGSAPSGKVFAMNLSTGVEQTVTFASGEDPFISQGYSWSFARESTGRTPDLRA